jgi:hypothetical protein
VVTETLPAGASPLGPAHASATASAGGAQLVAARSCRAWGYRLLGLELLFVAVGMCVR